MGSRIKPFFLLSKENYAFKCSSQSKAIKVNISIVRTFVKMRKLLASEDSLTDKLEQLEKGSDKLFRIVFERLDNLEENAPSPKDRNKLRQK
jgi:hypothetical protein